MIDPAVPQSKVILDTNVFVAAGFRPKSKLALLLHAVERGRLRMVWNHATRGEIEFVLNRIPPLAHRRRAELFRPEDRYDEATDPARFDYIPDPDDRKFAALSHATNSPLVTQDEHLLGARHRAAHPDTTRVR